MRWKLLFVERVVKSCVKVVVKSNGLLLVRGIDEVVHAAAILEDLFRTEEACQLDGGVLYGVGSMDDVLLVAHGVVTADGTGIGGTAVGKACHGTHDLYSLHTANSQGDAIMDLARRGKNGRSTRCA